MDIRIARTDRAIEKVFMELRAKNPLEKIKIKDLCALASVSYTNRKLPTKRVE